MQSFCLKPAFKKTVGIQCLTLIAFIFFWLIFSLNIQAEKTGSSARTATKPVSQSETRSTSQLSNKSAGKTSNQLSANQTKSKKQLTHSVATHNQSIRDTPKEPIIHQINRFVDQRYLNSGIFDRALRSINPEIQRIAIIGLGRIGGKKIIHRISPFLNNSSPQLRQAAAFALGISGEISAASALWQQLSRENDYLVKKEIYLGLGNIGEKNIITKLLQQLPREKDEKAVATLFQGMTIALVFHKKQKNDFSKINYVDLLSRFASNSEQSTAAGYFIDRIPGVDNFINASQLLTISQQKLSPMSASILARLIGKISIHQHSANRALLAWLIENSESTHQGTSLESIRALRNFLNLNLPQALIQIGKLQISSKPIIAQTALKTLADSELNTDEVIRLLKSKLKHNNPAMVVEAMSGLIKRNSKEEMSWIVKLFQHKNAFVKIRLISLLRKKSKTEFNNLIKFLTQDPDPQVSQYAQRVINNKEDKVTRAVSPAYSEVIKTINSIVTLKTSQGDIKIKLLADSPYTNWHFINNASPGNFRQTYFNRVIGNFVAQGGDTRGDGTGSSDKTIREEINFLSHEPMTVGMATQGKDTATSQFFINTARNLHLDREYTIFGRVIEGKEVVYKLTNGAMIEAISIKYY